jgi:outer membrane protein assembly factor BamB
VAILFGLGAGSASAGGTDLAVAYQINVAHSGVQTDLNLNPPFSPLWKATLPGPMEYALIANGDVYVTASNGTSAALYALDQQTGAVLWSKPIQSRYSDDAWPAYDAGRVFVVHNDKTCCSDGLMDAFDATTGAHLWTAILPGQYSFSSPPTASSGVVYTGGAGIGGTLYAVDETDGEVLATQSVENGDNSSPALSDHGVFVQYACDQTYGFAQQTLDPLWHYSTDCEGGGGSTPVYADGDVFTQDFFGNLILNAATGNLIRSWAPPGNGSPPPPAVDSNTLYFESQGALVAQDLGSGAQKWSFAGDGHLEPQPIVVATPIGEWVVIDSSAGNLYAVDAATGQLVWSGSLGTTIPDFPRLAAGQGLIVAPAGNVLAAYSGTATCSASVSSSISSSFNQTPIAAGRTIWFSSVLRASHLPKTPVTVGLKDATATFSANGTPYTVNVPNAKVTFNPGAKTATTGYDGTTQSWSTTVPSSIAGSVFLSGAGFPVPTSLPGGITPVSFTGKFTTDTPGVTVTWRWSAAVYTSFGSNPGQLGVKPVDDSKLSMYHNFDKAGTPEAYKFFVTGGAEGSGGTNYTGGDYSGANVTACSP